MKEAVLRNPESYTKSNRGRVKHIKKYGLTFDGSWELMFYEWCLEKKIEIIDNKKFFDYSFNNKTHLYNPDYYLPELDLYVEVKGFYDEKDLCKWKDFPEKLCICNKTAIDMITKNKFDINMIKENKKDFI